MPADIRQLRAKNLSKRIWDSYTPVPEGSRGGASNMRNCTLRAVWGWLRPAMALTPDAASAFHLRRTGHSGRNQKAVPGRRHSQGKPLSQGAVTEDQSGAGALSEAYRAGAGRHRTGRNTGHDPGADRPRHPGLAAGPEPDADR